MNQEQLASSLVRFSQELSQYNREDQILQENVSFEEIRKHLEKYDFQNPVDSQNLFSDVIGMLQKWTLNNTNPKYFGLYNPSTPITTCIADLLVALFNPQVCVWFHAPAAVEIERHVLNYIGNKIGYTTDNMFACFTSGGSEANMQAMLLAIAERCPDYIHHGLRSMLAPPTIYVCETSHHSFIKAVKSIGVGLDHMRIIPCDENNRMDIDALVRTLELDEEAGFIPTMVVGTAGTTSMGEIDPLLEIAEVCDEFGMWFHVDGAYGGGTLLSKKHAPVLSGIEKADSVTIDAHKMLSVPFGAGMFFTKNAGDLPENVFGISTDYVPKGNFESAETTNYYTSSIQWTRRFMGLKLFMSLAEQGDQSFENQLNQMFQLGEYMREKLLEADWTIQNDTPLPVICFTHKRIDDKQITTGDILTKVHGDEQFWISDVDVKSKGTKALRACITHYGSTEKDVDHMIDRLAVIVEELCATEA